jgi:hypothetical protein
MMTPPLSISARPDFTVKVPNFSIYLQASL